MQILHHPCLPLDLTEFTELTEITELTELADIRLSTLSLSTSRLVDETSHNSGQRLAVVTGCCATSSKKPNASPKMLTFADQLDLGGQTALFDASILFQVFESARGFGHEPKVRPSETVW